MKRLSDSTSDYLNYLDDWFIGLKSMKFHEFATNPSNVAILSVDVTEGFCSEGPLASTRVNGIVLPIRQLLEKSWTAGVRQVYLINDNHETDAVEFQNYPSHCMLGSNESQPVKEIKALPFFDEFHIVPKNSLSPNLNTTLPGLLKNSPGLQNFIVVGDCTDLCTYQLAMYLRLDANSLQVRNRRVIVPADCVDTYDTSVEAADKIGAFPHPADLLHRLFLNHMASNGIEVVSRIDF
jgi:nicotinamidase-related amidase